MADDFLSQDEVDALLGGVGDDDENDVVVEPEAETGSALPSGTAEPGDAPANSYKPANLEGVTRARLTRLENIHDRFQGLFQNFLLKFLGRKAEVIISPIRQIKYKDFIDKLMLPTSLNLAKLEPLQGNALFVLEPDLIFLLVDNLFGGEGRLHASETVRTFTLTEQRIIQRVFKEALNCYGLSWQEIYPLKLSPLRSETDTRFISFVADDDWIATATLSIQLGAGSGQMHLCIPTAALEPIRDLLCHEPQIEAPVVDKRWTQRMSRQLQSAEIELVARLSEIEVTLGDLMKMQPGDFIPFEMPETILVHSDSIPIMTCSYGISNQQYALRVEALLAPSPTGSLA